MRRIFKCSFINRLIGTVTLCAFLLSGCAGDSTQTVLQSQHETDALQTSESISIVYDDEETPGAESVIEEPDLDATIVMVGDVLLHKRVSDSGLMSDGSYNYDHLFAQVKDDIESADLAIVNQEVILGGRELDLSGYPCFNGAYEVGDSLVNAGFDVILHATNHSMDKGKKGLLNCMHFWKENYPDIGVLGIHETENEADDIYITDVNGINIAILNYTYGTNGIPLPQDMPYAVDIWDERTIEEDVNHAREEADFIIVCPHWGTEYELSETQAQKDKAQFLADIGVDLVIGTHPHVIEPVEWLTGKNGNRTLVYYSIGNFVNATSGTDKGVAARMVGAMAKIDITKDNDSVKISSYGVEPLVTHLVAKSGAITTYKLSDYTQDMALENKIRKQDAEFDLNYCKDLCSRVFKELYNSREESK